VDIANSVRQVVFVPKFTDVDEEKATLEQVADHIEYIGKRCGKAHVGISSDFGKYFDNTNPHMALMK
jgi:membrane dipeptidase